MNARQALWSNSPKRFLVASRHRDSGELRFPPYQPLSPLAGEYQAEHVVPSGLIYSLTKVHPNLKTGEAPFVVAYVDLPGPLRIFGRVVGEGAAIGKTCMVEPDDVMGYVFRLPPGAGYG